MKSDAKELKELIADDDDRDGESLIPVIDADGIDEYVEDKDYDESNDDVDVDKAGADADPILHGDEG